MKAIKKHSSKPFTDRVRALLGARPISEIAEHLSCTYEHVRRIFKEGHVPQDELVGELARALSTDAEELLYLASLQKTSDILRRKIRDLEGLVREQPGQGREGGAERVGRAGAFAIPLVGAASAKENGEARVEWNHEEFKGEISLKGGLRAIRVKGESLAPIALDGQVVIYDMERRPKKGDICVALVTKGRRKGETFIKRYFEEGDTVVLAPCWHTGEAITVKKGEADFYLVVGVWFAG
jgi:SOS-response transcriptional repressor LexA